MRDSDNMLSVLESYLQPSADEIARKLADDFRARRIEKNLTRDDVAAQAGIPVSNLVRFEQKALISLSNLIRLAIALGYISEIKDIFHTPKYSTMEELLQIKKNMGKKKAHKIIPKNEKD